MGGLEEGCYKLLNMGGFCTNFGSEGVEVCVKRGKGKKDGSVGTICPRISGAVNESILNPRSFSV
jgi:hypothetical protein